MTLGIYGSGGLGREILDLAREKNGASGEWDSLVFINDFREERVINGAEVFTLDEFKSMLAPDDARIVIAVGEPRIRQALREKAAICGYRLQTIVHPTAFVGAEAWLGDGVIIQYGSFISCNVRINDNVLVQPNANVGHDSVIGQDAVISSFAAISGACKIGERAYIGVSVPVKENISIGKDSIIGMGSAVLRDIPENVVALGNPARAMKDNESGRVFK